MNASAPKEEAPHLTTASFGNELSFWPAPKALQRMLTERGWDVFTAAPCSRPSRTSFLCLAR